jgi:signal transduction histidine kinase/CheY-like chemotaxis protein/HPt (histidine-containing phosphotransfer) domain-containing protein
MHALLLLGIALIGATAWQALHAADRRAEASASRMATAMAQDVARGMEQIDLTLQAVISRHQLTAAHPQQRNVQLFERTKRDTYVDFINILDANGGFVAGLPPQQAANSWAGRDYFIEQRSASASNPFIGRPYLIASEDKVSVPISRRITDTDGNFAGVAVIGLRLAYFRDLFRDHAPDSRDSVMLLRDDGVVLMRLPFDLNNVGRTLDAAAPFSRFIRAGASPGAAADPIDQVERRFAFRRVGTSPLVVGVGAAASPIYASTELWWSVTLLGVLGAAFALLTRRERQERRRREAAERDSQEKSRFLTTLSHELRTPLHGVLGYADQLSHEGGLSTEQSRQLDEIVHASKHMRDVVNVVLDYARIEALGPALHMKHVEVRHLVEECLAVIGPGARARGLEIRNTAAPDAPVQFVTDDIQLRQILMNLLSNAVKYTPSGVIEVRLSGDAAHLMIEVTDTGIGIPEGQRHHLFNEYERFGAERTSIEGTGLGLAIAHRLARRLGGHMGHRDNPGGGSVFWLELPAGVPDKPGVVVEPEAAVPPERLSVLVADDSDVNRDVAVAFLRKAAHTTSEARDGDVAVRLAAALDFDVVLMDMRMPGMDGLEATRRIRALDGRRGQVPIVAVTANALDQHAEECRRAGMSAHLAKPFTRVELLAVVARAAGQRPRPVSDAVTTIDADSLAQLADCMGEDALQRLLDCLALRIESLLRQLEDPAKSASPDQLGALAHELVGSGGTLGFTRLAAAARGFESAVANGGAADTAEMRHEATAALSELRRRRSLEALPAD